MKHAPLLLVSSFLKKYFLFIHLWLIGSLLFTAPGFCLVAVQGLIAVASLTAAHGSRAAQASAVVACGLKIVVVPSSRAQAQQLGCMGSCPSACV